MDAAGNSSAYSLTISAITPVPPDTQPPTAPTGLAASAISGSQINMSWNASTDNVGVVLYRVERCFGAGCTVFAEIGTSITTTYVDNGLVALTVYSYRIKAVDAAGNGSAYSAGATATTIQGANIYSYDTIGRLQSVTTPTGSKIQYTYDAAGHLIGAQTTP